MFASRQSVTLKSRTRSATRRRANPMLETLDGRLLLSATPVMIQPTLETDYFTVTGVPSQITAGTPFTITVTEYAYATGKEVNDNGLSVALSADVGGTDTSLGSATLNAGKASVTLTKAEKVDDIFVTSGSISNPKTYITGAEGPVVVNPGAASQLIVTAPPTETVGSNFGVKIQAEDRYMNPVSFSGNIAFKASDGQAVVTSGVLQNGSVTVSLNEPDTLTLTASSGSIAGTSNTITEDAISQTNSIWSGYAASTGTGVTAAGGTWVQPSGSGTNGSQNSVWVGIDGFGGSTVEQLGTATTIVNGTPQIVAWYEFFGDASGNNKGPDYYQQNISNFPVHAGDTISAEVSLVAGKTNSFLFQMTDKPKAGGALETFSLTQTMKYVTPQRSTAEWIVENPNNGGQPLANFGQVNFSGAWATVNSTTTPINKLASLRLLNMTSGSSVLDVTTNPPGISNTLGYNEPASGLQSSSFTITYIGNNPGSLASPSAEPLPTTLLSFNAANSNPPTGEMAGLAPADHLEILDAAFGGWHREIGQGIGLGSQDHIDDLFA